ncbi:MAG: hypothetical protein WDN67_01235 [Candidatus Moraniibacteriota bacterium]
MKGMVAAFWVAFLRGENPFMCYLANVCGLTLPFPLYCDFVHRDEPRPMGSLGLGEWMRLAKTPVIRKTMEEIGITLELA